MTVQESLNQGLQRHQAGKLAEAEAFYRQILGQQPDHADALHLLGVLAHQTGHHDAALELIGRAVKIGPRQAQYRVNLAIVLDTLNRLEEAAAEFARAAELQPMEPQMYANLAIALRKAGQLDRAVAAARQVVALRPNSVDSYITLAAVLREGKQWDEALTCCHRALAIAPKSAEAYNNLGYVLHGQGKLDEAIAAYRQAVALKPDLAQGHANLGLALGDKRQWKAAIEACQRALVLRPDDAETYCTLAHMECGAGRFDAAVAACRQAIALRPDLRRAHVNLAAALRDKRLFNESVECCRSALARWPTEAGLHNALGHALMGLERYDEAIAALRQAVALGPGLAQAHNNLGLALDRLGKHDEGIAALRQAIASQPDFAEAHNNLGNALAHKGDFAGAVQALNAALSIWPEYPSAHWNLGLVQLLQGDYEHGWAEYEWRWRVRDFGMRLNFPGPAWKGDTLSGLRILLHAEQGFGDIIQLSRFVPLVAERGGNIVLACQPALHRLFQQTWPLLQCVDQTDAAAYCDVHCPVMSLPLFFGTTTANIPAEPYLTADAEQVRLWQRRSPQDSRLKVGFVWANRPTPPNRCPPAADWAVLAGVKNVWLCSLQKEKVGEPPQGLEIADWTAELTDFADTAALIASLDLVITVDTAVAHLAGALGKPTWLLLKYVPDWRWMMERSDSPWYPTLRLFRQPRPQDWHTPVGQIAEALAAGLSAHG